MTKAKVFIQNSFNDILLQTLHNPQVTVLVPIYQDEVSLKFLQHHYKAKGMKIFRKLILCQSTVAALHFVIVSSLSHAQHFGTPWNVAHRAPLSIGFPGHEYWVGCHFLLQGIFPTQGSNPSLLHWQDNSSTLSHLGSPTPLLWDNVLHFH